MKPTAQVKNWAEFQHYKDRSPPWIKLHRAILDDFNFSSLPLASKALAPLLWLLAAETVDGTVSVDPEFLAFRLRWKLADINAGLSPLIAKGFLVNASKPLAARLHVATPETETETETDSERETKKKTAPSGVDFGEVAPQVVADFTAHRKAQRAPITQTALDAIRREAGKAGMTLEAALAMCCARGWRGFKADWAGEQQARAGPTQAPGKTMQALKTLEDMKNGLANTRNLDRIPEAALLEFGSNASR